MYGGYAAPPAASPETRRLLSQDGSRFVSTITSQSISCSALAAFVELSFSGGDEANCLFFALLGCYTCCLLYLYCTAVCVERVGVLHHKIILLLHQALL